MGERCKSTQFNGPGFPRYRCRNRAKYGDFCGVHSPERKAARAAQRGPTPPKRKIPTKKDLEAENARLNETNSELLREKGEAWGIQFCCNGHECGCHGEPTNPPTWWCEMQNDLTRKAEALRPFDRVAGVVEELGSNSDDWQIIVRMSNDPDREVIITAAHVKAARAALQVLK